ncbi:MAG: ribosomal protein L13e [Candidatus Freyarchaeota archaeon]|nr:ribosomal protein L13e [Candidatus Freyrarchaeum guaymaensis]
MSELKAMVRPPRQPQRLREGRGFSIAELKEAGLTLHDAKQVGIRVDVRRKTVHMENVKALKDFMKKLVKGKAARRKAVKEKEVKKAIEKVEEVEGTEKKVMVEGEVKPGKTPLTILKGLGAKTAQKFAEVGIESVEELAEEDAELLSEALGIKKERVASWIDEAKDIVKKSGGRRKATKKRRVEN